MSERHYSGKLLLLGEYTIIKGGYALAIPLSLYQSQWRWASPEQAAKQQQRLWEWADYLSKLKKRRPASLFFRPHRFSARP